MSQRFFLFCSFYLIGVHSDVSHLFKNAYNTYQAALNTISSNGYYYEPPLVPTTPRPLPPTTPFLPEIIVNKQTPDITFVQDIPRHVYLPPVEQPIIIPTQSDELELPYPAAEVPPAPSYLPPAQNIPHYDPPSNNYLPPPEQQPLDDPGTIEEDGYHYPTPGSRGLKDLLHTSKPISLQLDLNDLRCLNGRIGFFRANIVVHNFINSLPIIDTDVQDPRCSINLVRNKFVINLVAKDFQHCGVYACSEQELCLRLRFPQIHDMKSIGDAILTLQCKIQEKTVSKTHALRFGVNNFDQARSAGTYAHGGTQQFFRTHLGLFQNSNGAFTRKLESGSPVQLGEELMLRAQVKSGDGWNYSRVSDVSLQQLSPTGDILHSVTLINPNGCVNPSMRSICPYPPVFEAPLGYRFAFHVVMFQNMKSGDEMVMSVRIVGCMDQRDCVVEHQHCSDKNILRSRRDLQIADTEKDDFVEVSRISFRVEMPHHQQKQYTTDINSSNVVGGIVAAITICCIIIMAIVVLSISNRQHLRKIFR